MTFEEKKQQKILEAQQAVEAQKEEYKNSLLDNSDYIEVQRSLYMKDKELKKLNATVEQLNSIPSFKSKNGDKFDVRVFPINAFKTGTDVVLGIINGSRSAFVDELSLQYEAITGISMIELTLARQALGQPIYFSKGKLSEEIPADVKTLNNFLASIAIKLDISEFNLMVTQSEIDLWFLKEKIKAETALAEFEKAKLTDSTTSFTIED